MLTSLLILLVALIIIAIFFSTRVKQDRSKSFNTGDYLMLELTIFSIAIPVFLSQSHKITENRGQLLFVSGFIILSVIGMIRGHIPLRGYVVAGKVAILLGLLMTCMFSFLFYIILNGNK